MKKQAPFVLGGLSILIPLYSFAINSPTNLSLSTSQAAVQLSWNNPSDLDFDHIELRRSTSTYPIDHIDGYFVTSGTINSYNDTGLADATYYYSLFAMDLSGNRSDATTGSIYVDATGPVFSAPGLTGVVLGSGGVIAQREVSDANQIETFRYQIINTNTSGILVDTTINNIRQTSYTGSLGLDKAFIDAGGTGGDYAFVYTATDTYGNTSTRQLGFVYDPENILDTTGPIVSTTPTSGQIVSANAPFSWTITDNTLEGASVYFRIAGDPDLTLLAYQNSFVISNRETTQTISGTVVLPDGNFYVGSTVTDYIGNQTITPSVPFQVDDTKPVITYTGNATHGTTITQGMIAHLMSNVFDTHLDGGHIHTFIGTTPNFDQTRPSNGLYHGGNAPLYSTSSGIISIPNLTPGTYYRYVEANDVVGNYTSGAMQSFTVVAAPRRSGGGGGVTSMDKDTCLGEDKSGSSYDHKCFDDTGIPLSQRQKVLSVFASGTTATDTTNPLTVHGFITDVFKILGISYSGAMPEAYKTSPLAEKFYNKVLTRLYKIFAK